MGLQEWSFSMSEWRWYTYLMRQCDCILGNVGQQGEYQNKTSNRSIISVSWPHALRRHALETGALISLCTGLKSVLNSDHSHLHSRFPKSVLILFSGKWDVVSVFSDCRTWTSSINITGGNWREMQVLSPLQNQKLLVWGQQSQCSCGLWGDSHYRGKRTACCRTGLAEAKSPRRKTPELNPCSFRPCTSSENLQSLSVLFYKMGIISESTI